MFHKKRADCKKKIVKFAIKSLVFQNMLLNSTHPSCILSKKEKKIKRCLNSDFEFLEFASLLISLRWYYETI